MNIFKSKVVAISLAIAMTFSVIATPIANAASAVTTTDEAAQFLSEVGLLQGDGNGDLMLDSNLTREQATVAMSRLLGVETEAEVYATDGLTFTDVADEYYAPFVAWAQDNGLVQGYSETEFGYGDQLTAWQTMALFVRALGYTDTADDQIATVAAELGITANSTAEEQAPISRGDMALLMFNTINAKTVEGTVLGEDLGVLDAEVATDVTYTASAASVNTIKVVFNAAVDTTKATIAVVKDDVTAKVANVTWNDAKTEASLEMAIDLTEGDYVVTVAGIEVKTASATVTVKDEETAKIEFLSDKAVLVSGGTDVYTYVKVTNQYGEDITEDASLTCTATSGTATLDAANGKIEIVGTYEVDDVITVTALDSDSGAFATAKLTVVEAAAPDKVEVTKVYSDDEDAKLIEGTIDGTFSLLLKVYDQYGNEMTDDSLADIKDGLVVSSSNTSRITVDKAQLVGKTVDDVDYISLPLQVESEEGSATVRFISSTTGKTTTYDLTVLPESKIAKISVISPAIAVAGEEVKFEVSATDENGEAVTDASTFENVDLGVETSISGLGENFTATYAGDISFNKETGKIYLVLDTTNVLNADLNLTNADKTNEYKTIYMTLVTATNEVVQKSFKLYERAVPTTVSKLTDVKTGILEGSSTDIVLSDDADDNNVEILDQYGRAMDWTDVTYAVEISTDDTDVTTESAVVGDVTTFTVNGVTKGSATVTLTLKNGLTVVDTLDFTATVVELADIVSYEVADINTMYAPSPADINYNVDVDVYGILSNGTKVAIPASMYSIITTIDGVDATENVLSTSAAAITEALDGEKSVAGKVVVTIGGANGPVDVEKDITVSTVAPKATSYELVDGTTETVPGTPDVTVENGTAYIAASNLVDANDILEAVEITDQYGVVASIVPASTVFSNVEDAEEVEGNLLTTNNTTGAITNVASGDSFTVTFVYSNGYKVTVNVVVD